MDADSAKMLTDFEFTILASVTDDDYTIWETEWWLNSQYPEQRGATNRELARAAVRRLFALGLIEVFWSDGWRRRIGDMVAEEFYTETEKDANWDPDETPPPWVGCTSKEFGWQIYNREYRARHPDASGR